MSEEPSHPAPHQLGPLISEHRLRRDLQVLYPAVTGVGLIGSLAAAAAGVWRGYFAYAHYGPALVWRWVAPALWASAGIGLLGILGAISAWRARNLWVQTYHNGLIAARGRRRMTIPWREIRSVHTRVTRYGLPGLSWRTRTVAALHTYDGRRLDLSQALSDVEALVETVKGFVYAGLLPELTRTFNRGQPLSFGPLILTQEGVRRGRKLLRWEDLGAVTLHRGVLHLHPREPSRAPRLRVPAHKVPNVDLCVQLLHQLGEAP